ncbi:hypothetical protein N9B20_01175 [Mariniblastus sp.]|nr:hypothetical protein [Mariniblastus sp.]
MNRLLKELYDSYWNQLILAANKAEINAAYPLLIKVCQKYVDADLKVMIVGQETDGWCGQLSKADKSVEEVMEKYSKYLYEEVKDKNKRPFWNIKNFKFFETEITKHFSNGKSVEFVWNNISKIGRDKRGKPSRDIRDLELNHFNVFRKEFKILNPGLVIFTTGKRDDYIKRHFGPEVSFISVLNLKDGTMGKETKNLIAEVRLPNFSNVKAVRVEHPNRRSLDNAITLQVIKNLCES